MGGRLSVQQVWCKWLMGRSPVGGGGVDAGHQLAVGGAGGGEVLVAFVELQAQLDGLLFEVGDLLVEGVDVGGGAQPGLAPCLLAECLGEPFLEVLDSGVEPVGAFVRGEQVGLQGGSGDGRAGAVAGGGWFGVGGVDLLEQVAVSVEEAAVDPCCAGGGGHADPGAVGDGALQRGQDALSAACGVGVTALAHRLGPCVCRGGVAGWAAGGGVHAVACAVVVVGEAGAAAATVGMPSGTVWAAW